MWMDGADLQHCVITKGLQQDPFACCAHSFLHRPDQLTTVIQTQQQGNIGWSFTFDNFEYTRLLLGAQSPPN